MEDDARHYLPSACAYDLLPRVLYGNPALRYRWEGLFACIERLFWNRIYYSGRFSVFPIEAVREGLQALDADPRAVLPVVSGPTGRQLKQARIRDALLEQA